MKEETIKKLYNLIKKPKQTEQNKNKFLKIKRKYRNKK